jgi:hypothetical protein
MRENFDKKQSDYHQPEKNGKFGRHLTPLIGPLFPDAVFDDFCQLHHGNARVVGPAFGGLIGQEGDEPCNIVGDGFGNDQGLAGVLKHELHFVAFEGVFADHAEIQAYA